MARRRSLYDEDGIDGPFERAVAEPIDWPARVRERLAVTQYAIECAREAKPVDTAEARCRAAAAKGVK